MLIDPEHNLNDKAPQIDLFLTPSMVTDDQLKGYNVVVIDVLRAATTITTAFANGVKEVIPAESISHAIDISTELGRRDVLLCGERRGRLVDGFHLGNSPTEYKREVVEGKTLIFGSTNGSPTIVKTSEAITTYLCAFVNIKAVVNVICNLKKPYPLSIICSGKYNQFALEDAVCGGMLINKYLAKKGDDVLLNDGARTSLVLYREYGDDIVELLKTCDHGKYIKEIGMESDLEVCAQKNSIDIVPFLHDGKLIPYRK